jgi:hypothetical protein
VGEKLNVEVHEKAAGNSLQAHISHELCGVDRKELVYRFYFDNKRIFD